MSHKYVYLFSEADGSMRELLGGKGANLAEMTNLGLPVPFGFTVSTEACARYYEDGRTIADDIETQIIKAMENVEAKTGKKFGDVSNPLLVSVRSGARASMPGMMDTILNLGLNPEVAAGLAKLTNNDRFAYDSYRRFIQMFADVVMDISKAKFDVVMDALLEEKGVKLDDLDAEGMKEVVVRFLAKYKEEKGEDFPTDPKTQLLESVKAVFRSWDNPRANYYRRMNDIPYSWGTAVNVQEMVFGNTGQTSGTGVSFTRNAATGENKIYGEFLIDAQGEDVVAGIRTPLPIADLGNIMPEVYKEFVDISELLEKHYKDMQDLEYTIEYGKLFILQTRGGKRTAAAALKIAVDLVDEGMITEEEAVMRVDPKQLDQLLHPQFDVAALNAATPLGSALPASPGAACGRVVFTAAEAVRVAATGEPVILTRLETSPEDIEGMDAATGILTVRGGMTSHAAVVARGMGICCVSGCGDIIISEEEGYFSLGGKTIKAGDFISLDGSTGNIYGEAIATVEAEISGDFRRYMTMVDKVRDMKVRANADNPRDVKQAIQFGAEGVGLCRTEHMFFEGTRIKGMREMIVAKTKEAREKALAKLLPYQQGDFEDMYEALESRPMTIRFLDPPLHEFLPTKNEDIKALSDELDMSVEALKNVITSLHEFNPMMGHRGCRLTVSYPEIAVMQTTAVISAAIAVSKKHPEFNIVPEIMIPLIGEVKELQYVKKFVVETADKLIADAGIDMKYMVGTMIEIPRATVTADKIATEAEFFSFGTNDLTQMTFGFSRDDAGSFLDSYYDSNIYESDPFARLDQEGVGQLVKIAVEKGRSARPNIKLGVCGEHGGDPSSVEFFYGLGLDYVSCSPFRVPIARLAAAQAALKKKNAK